ncbi:MAG: alginate export family protein [Sphingobium sp.]|uniref:alginate export family protein n=1 Tax=Sphingobium sp. TaxID=1912891 RepID=UPI0029B26A55|nr:alginate export family protein [Sphingobium sp.]MDX3909755.1 alginate export family protein [Sphingobium sp.]
MRYRRTIIFGASIAGVTITQPALADPFKLKPIVETRLRYEGVDQLGLARDADAVTLRMRSGVEAIAGDFSILVEGEGTLALSGKYNSGVNGKAAYPIVADPETIELNRVQLQFRGLAKTLMTVGRQRINLDDQRFVGSVNWRQNEQTFDAARVEWTGIKDVKADVTYAWSQRTIWGIDGSGARQQAVSGDNILANLSWKLKTGTLTGFAYVVDQDEAAITYLGRPFSMSSKTFGGRAAFAIPISHAVKLNLLASYARQSDYHRSQIDYAADYWLGEIGLATKGWTLTGGYEVLGATGSARNLVTNAQVSASVQTPLATLHKFNGWADKFLVTPPNGLRDAYASLGYVVPKLGGTGPLSLLVTYHRFDSDPLSIDYGSEWNAQASLKLNKKLTALVKYADYDADAFATDTRKMWVQLDYGL